MTLETRLQELAQVAGSGDKALKVLINGNAADLSDLTTTNKSSLLAALNEVAASVATAAGIDDNTTGPSTTWSSSKTSTEIAAARSGAVDDAIDDTATASTTSTLSASAILTAVANAKSEIIGGAGAAYDTLVEIQGLLQDNDSALGAINDGLANRVRVDAAQTFDPTMQATARSNIGAAAAADLGNTDRDLAADFQAALL